ncbi:hypothetical protein LTR78_007964 [Recurvomyces mirabilis]|uniref:SMP-30/Gluconolactonase/LRE-like region domain-containing protein n=1 Tax=Recurvomyces mirabilis TaxID=574656 RepID=A0AAE0WJ59_9PEZI|nr:hypothetical protein LTR78_007964 [Recurvomyces mirabilis]KAK5152500.1 hypothetical protein LTS14_008447 [Recurvomyces mirabilis]
MSAPQQCRRISREEKTICSKSIKTQKLDQPVFAIYEDTFLDVVGKEPSITCVLERDYAFAHEAPVYIPEQDAVYFTSNVLVNKETKVKYTDVGKASRGKDGKWTYEKIATDVSMGNGAINYQSGILFCAQGHLADSEPGGLVVMDTNPPYATKTLIDGFHGRQFNSVNDIVTHTDGSIWFTDPTYGFQQDFRPKPVLPNLVYRFDPETADIRVVADGLGMPNGLCFSPDEKVVYITDTDHIHAGDFDPTRAGTIYAYDVVVRHGGQFLENRRVFAMTDATIPDGIKCDMQGNVYAGCADGVNVWSPGGKLIGKILVGSFCANFCFTKAGEIFVLSEEKAFVARIAQSTKGALLHYLGF